MKIDEIKTIVKLMADNELTEFNIEAEDMHLCIRRGSAAPSPIIAQALPVAAPQPQAPLPAPAAANDEEPQKETKKQTVDSPIVGTFYRSSAPGVDAFVKIGSKVEPDTTVCIIEAMKVMNEIKAEKAGIIREILVENGQPVEFGQPLFVLE